MFGDIELGKIFVDLLGKLKSKLRTGSSSCKGDMGPPPVYWNVNMHSGRVVNYWVDSLQASWSAVLASLI